MLLRHSLKVTQPFTRSLLRPQSTSASSAAAPSSALAHWLEGLPRSTIRQQDHVALTQVQGLVSTLELPEDGLAENWKHGDTLPPGWTLLYFPGCLARTSQLQKADGTEETPHHPPASEGLERMWAGGSFTFPKEAAPIQIGQDITSEATISSVKVRTGKDGRKGYYIEQRRDIRVAGATTPSVIETRTHLYRPSLPSKPSPSAVSPSKPRRAGEDDRRADFSFPYLPTPPHLFRFSALTFNTHRIHWDEAYCRNVEHREGLIVHGPLTALMLLTRFHHALPEGMKVESFTYRATAPLVVDRPITFKGRWDSTSKMCDLWVEGEDGTVFMSGVGSAVAAS